MNVHDYLGLLIRKDSEEREIGMQSLDYFYLYL